jgi:hypothetical protein
MGKQRIKKLAIITRRDHGKFRPAVLHHSLVGVVGDAVNCDPTPACLSDKRAWQVQLGGVEELPSGPMLARLLLPRAGISLG